MIKNKLKQNICGIISSVFLLYPLLIEASPDFVITGSMEVSRAGHTATLLTNGKVLVTGGSSSQFSESVSTAELFDSVTGSWTNTSPLNTGRNNHTASLLPNGTVLIAGGDGISRGLPVQNCLIR